MDTLNKSGMCQWCNRRFPIKADKIIRHFKRGTRIPCAPSHYQEANLPKTDAKAILGRPVKKWRGPRGFAILSKNYSPTY